MMRSTAGIALLWLALAAACIRTNEAARHGDAAAARGDWKTAERSYRIAIGEEPGNADLGRRYQQAREQAIAVALRTAEACRARGDLVCVDGELGYVLQLDPGNVEAATARAAAQDELIGVALAEARASLDARQPMAALTRLDQARELGPRGDAVARFAELERAAVAAALAEAEALVAAATARGGGAETLATLDAALALARAVGARDPAAGDLERRIAEQRRQVAIAATREQLAEAEVALEARAFARAAAIYEAVATVTGETTHRQRAAYAGQLARAEEAAGRRDFDDASAALRAAVATGEDLGQVAATWLAQVEPRVYRIRLDGVLITPGRPGTNAPWVGPSWTRQVLLEGGGALVGFVVAGTAGAAVGRELGKAAASVPVENQPTLRVVIELPDGRIVATAPAKGVLMLPDAELWLRSNHVDRRNLVVRIQKMDGDDEYIGQFRVTLGELVSQRVLADLGVLAPAVQGVQFWTEPGDPALDGALRNLTVTDGENQAARRSQPRAGRSRYRVTAIEASVTGADLGDDFSSAPDPYVVIKQDGVEVFRSRTAQDTRSGRWSLATTELFVADDEVISIDVYDADPMETDHAFAGIMSGAMLATGRATFSTPGGSAVTIHASRYADGPR